MALGHGRVLSTSSLLPISDRPTSQLMRSGSVPQNHGPSTQSRSPSVPAPARQRSVTVAGVMKERLEGQSLSSVTSASEAGASGMTVEQRKRSTTIGHLPPVPTTKPPPLPGGLGESAGLRSSSVGQPPSRPVPGPPQPAPLRPSRSEFRRSRSISSDSRPGTSPGSLPLRIDVQQRAPARPATAEGGTGYANFWDGPHSTRHAVLQKALPSIPQEVSPAASPVKDNDQTATSMFQEVVVPTRAAGDLHGFSPSLPVFRRSEEIADDQSRSHSPESPAREEATTQAAAPSVSEQPSSRLTGALPAPSPLRIPSLVRRPAVSNASVTSPRMGSPRTPRLPSGPRPAPASPVHPTPVVQDSPVVQRGAGARSPSRPRPELGITIGSHSTSSLATSYPSPPPPPSIPPPPPPVTTTSPLLPSQLPPSSAAPAVATTVAHVRAPSDSTHSEDVKSPASTEAPAVRSLPAPPGAIPEYALHDGSRPNHHSYRSESPSGQSVLGSPPPYHVVCWDCQPPQDEQDEQRHHTQQGQAEPPPNNANEARPLPSTASTEGSFRRVRVRPPLPAGPRMPSIRRRADTLPSSGSRRRRLRSSAEANDAVLHSPVSRISSNRWPAYTLDGAKLVFTSEQLQSTVSQAIRHSAQASSIRLLRPEDVETRIPTELSRLEERRIDIKAQFASLKRARDQTLSSLSSMFSSTEAQGSGSQHVQELRNVSARLDKLCEDLHTTGERIAELRSLLAAHQSSALSVALRKLNSSFQRRCAELNREREHARELEAERDEAWQHASAVAKELDEMCVKVEGSTPGSSRRSSRVIASRKSSLRVSRAGLRPSSSSRRTSTISSGAKSGYSSDSDGIPPVPRLPGRSSLSPTAGRRPRALSDGAIGHRQQRKLDASAPIWKHDRRVRSRSVPPRASLAAGEIDMRSYQLS
ncbi:uncharacterized protein SCHCODRAFT_02506543 [Schizophyllum commune H4-8]|uniref:uncharacterized protein n=1 Tax=Schizophyllum commune (strain H4-8 / FGSC 9210) TaxID=578458 RepID=UPI00215ED8C0|nr:uncharacterized protein SCHCODRAFT_02506543 [Schizophyllum commune H4-8]KAI5891408.1 hypothetical protein SCHCODRAFT_02506543 [Schizophyllum commune H4-8]